MGDDRLPSASTTSTVALLGFMGAGKSSVGVRLAARLGLPFVDLDQLFVARHGPIADRFETEGEESFRADESRLLHDVLAGPPVVVATGGGIVERLDNVAALERSSVSIFIDAPLDVCQRRVGRATNRPVWPDAVARFDRRRPVYGLARHTVDGRGPVDAVVERVLGALRGFDDVLADHTALHPVWSARSFDGLAATAELDAFDGLHIVTDDRVGPLWSAALTDAIGTVPVCVIPNGERHKTIDTWRLVVDHLLAHRVSRTTAVVALGGGVVGDIAGFAASTVNRGMPVVHVPTTTLAMIDSSVGGKTSVNHPRGKNLVGAFHVPHSVWMADQTLTTLEPRHARAGLAEAVKMALTHSAAAFGFLESVAADLTDQPSLVQAVVRHAVRTKSGVVARDTLEAGERALLNAGHTVGHGLERAHEFGTLLHGEAVAIGLCAELAWGEREGHTRAGTHARVRTLLQAIGLPTDWPRGTDAGSFRAAVAVDKKARCDTLVVPIAREPGEAVRVIADTSHFTNTILELSGQPPS